MKFLSYTATKGSYAKGIWKIGTLESGESAVLKITTKVLSDGFITNPVSVSADEFDNDTSNNNASFTVKASNKTVPDKHGDGPVNHGNSYINIGEKVTGNPLIVLLLVIVSIVLVPLKRKF